MDQLDLTVDEDEFLQLGRLLMSVCDPLLAVTATPGFWCEDATAFGHTNVRFRATAIIAAMTEVRARSGNHFRKGAVFCLSSPSYRNGKADIRASQ